MGFSSGAKSRIALSNIVLTKVASGDVLIFHVTRRPSKQSTIGDKYTLPAGSVNSIISVNHFLLGFDAEKFLSMIFSTADDISP